MNFLSLLKGSLISRLHLSWNEAGEFCVLTCSLGVVFAQLLFNKTHKDDSRKINTCLLRVRNYKFSFPNTGGCIFSEVFRSEGRVNKSEFYPFQNGRLN